MSFLTDRKRAAGLGSAKSGVEHFWAMKKSSAALLVLVPLFIFTFGSALGSSQAEVLAYYSRPFPAIVAGLTLLVGMRHFIDGAQIAIEDYVHGAAEKIAILALNIVGYGLAATGLFAIARIAL